MMIKNLIFDVGRVLLDYRWEDVLMASGVSPEEASRIGADIFGDPVWHEKFDRGLMDEKELTRSYIRKHPADEDAYRYFFSHPEDMPVKRPEVLKRLPLLKEKGYSLYILSDYSKYLSDVHFKFGGFLEYFDGVVISYMEHMIKPDPDLFRLLLDRYDLVPGETVFFDDKKENALGAEKAGIQGIHVPSEKDLLEAIDSFL